MEHPIGKIQKLISICLRSAGEWMFNTSNNTLLFGFGFIWLLGSGFEIIKGHNDTQLNIIFPLGNFVRLSLSSPLVNFYLRKKPIIQ